MQLILIAPGFTADTTDQNCLPTLQLYVQELLRRGVSVSVVTLEYPFHHTPYTWHGARIYPCGGRNSRWLKPRTLWRAWRTCRQLVQQHPGAVLHSFWLGWCSAIGERVALEFGSRHLTTLMGQDVLPSNRHRFRFVTPERQQRLVALSAFQNEVLWQHAGFGAAHVVPWGAEVREIPEPLASSRSIDVLGAGSLIPLKNWDLWLQTVALLVQKQPTLQALLLGDGPEKQRLQQQVEALGLQENVRFGGERPRPEVLQIMQQSRVLLHTSRYESQGYVLTEAAMNGCRVVGTSVGIGPTMGVCGDTAFALAEAVQAALALPLATLPATPFLMQDTVDAYVELYR
jgi:glycosyltransferase involved in cell wall biosynthesis